MEKPGKKLSNASNNAATKEGCAPWPMSTDADVAFNWLRVKATNMQLARARANHHTMCRHGENAGQRQMFLALDCLNLRLVPTGPWVLQNFRGRWAVEDTAIYRTAAAGRSKWLLEPARSSSGARNGCSSPPRSRRGARNWPLEPASASLGRSKWPLEPARLRWGGRNRCSGLLGFAGAFKLTARARSASLGRSSFLGFAGAGEIAAQACSASLERSNSALEPARPRWGARHRCSSSLG